MLQNQNFQRLKQLIYSVHVQYSYFCTTLVIWSGISGDWTIASEETYTEVRYKLIDLKPFYLRNSSNVTSYSSGPSAFTPEVLFPFTVFWIFSVLGLAMEIRYQWQIQYIHCKSCGHLLWAGKGANLTSATKTLFKFWNRKWDGTVLWWILGTPGAPSHEPTFSGFHQFPF